MTLEEYKSQVKEITQASQNFKGTPEEAVKLFEDLAKKYPQVNEFNTKAMDCKDLTEFKNLADAFGMKFSSDDSAEKLFSMLQDGKKQLKAAALKMQNGAELSDDDLAAIAGGGNMWFATLVVGACAVLGGAFGAIAGPGGVGVGAGIGLMVGTVLMSGKG